jgi:hypothetical protein
MITNKIIKGSQTLTCFLIFALIISSCSKEKIEEYAPTVALSAKTIEYHKSLEDYPTEITIDNWEDFVYAPQLVIDHFTQKEIAEQAPKEYNKLAKPSLASTRSSFVIGGVSGFNAFNQSWEAIGGVNISLGGNSLASYSYYWWFLNNYFVLDDGSGILCMDYPTSITNGVNTLDLVKIERQILGLECFTHAYQFLAADINRDGDLNNADILELRMIVLGILNNFTNSDNVLFIPEQDYNDMQNLIPECPLNNNGLLANYIGLLGTAGPCLSSTFKNRRVIKTGDVNGTFSF